MRIGWSRTGRGAVCISERWTGFDDGSRGGRNRSYRREWSDVNRKTDARTAPRICFLRATEIVVRSVHGIPRQWIGGVAGVNRTQRRHRRGIDKSLRWIVWRVRSVKTDFQKPGRCPFRCVHDEWRSVVYKRYGLRSDPCCRVETLVRVRKRFASPRVHIKLRPPTLWLFAGNLQLNEMNRKS